MQNCVISELASLLKIQRRSYLIKLALHPTCLQNNALSEDTLVSRLIFGVLGYFCTQWFVDRCPGLQITIGF